MSKRLNHCIITVSKANKEAGISEEQLARQLKDVYEEAMEMAGGDVTLYPAALRNLLKSGMFEDFAPDLERIKQLDQAIKVAKALISIKNEYGDMPARKALNRYLDRVDLTAQAEEHKAVEGLVKWMFSTQMTDASGQKMPLFVYYKARQADKGFNLNFAKEMEAISAGKASNQTGDMGAYLIAQKVHEMRDMYRGRLFAAGQKVKNRKDYQGAQSLDRDRVLATGEARFIDVMQQHINWEKMFSVPVPATTRTKILKGYYKSITEGEGTSYAQGKFLTGDGVIDKVGKKYERDRTIIYKAQESYLEVMSTFGTSELLIHNAFHDLKSLARDSVLVEYFGSNSASGYRALAREVGAGTQSDVVFKQVTGEANMIGSHKYSYQAAQIFGGARNVITSAMMGEILFAALPDMAVASVARQRAIGGYTSVIRPIQDLMTSSEGKPASAFINAYAHAVMPSMTSISKIGNAPTGTGITGIMASTTMRLGGMTWLETKQRAGVVNGVSAALYEYRNLSFNEINSKAWLGDRMSRFGITEQMWNLYRRLPAYKDPDGNSYLTTDIIKDISNKEFAQKYMGLKRATPLQVAAAKREMVSAFETYFMNIANNAVLKSNATDRRWQNLGYKRGTVAGEFIRSTMHLTTYPLLVLNRVITPAIENRDFASLSLYVFQATVLGYMSMMARDQLRGRTRDYLTDDPDQQMANFFEAFQRGGAGGIIYDMLYQMANFGDDPSARLGGMSMGALQDAFRLMNSAGRTIYSMVGDDDFEDESRKLARDTVRMARQHIPFGTLPIIRQMIDSLIYYPTMNMIDPETMRRVERNWEQRTGGSYYFSPTGG